VDPSEHLFRHQAGRMVAVLTRIFGVHNLALAEDVVQDAFCRALEVWKFQGMPENPEAWLMATAKRRALDVLRRERTARTFAPELGWMLETEWTLASVVSDSFGSSSIRDDQLRMMFSCCHHRISEEAQVALILNVICAFSASEVAGAFLITDAAAEKRIARGKKVLRESKTLFDVADSGDFDARLTAVQRALYLLFNEGYHGASPAAVVRPELCEEAMRLVGMLLAHPGTATPSTRALAALFSLHAARLPGRVDEAGRLQSLFDQDRSRWDAQLVAEGQRLLDQSATGNQLTEYHIEAAIAAVHVQASSAERTDWAHLVSLYDLLFEIRPSPVVALNRAIAVAQASGPERGLEAIRGIPDASRLAHYPFYYAALGELELRAGHPVIAREHFDAASTRARNPMEREFLERRIAACG